MTWITYVCLKCSARFRAQMGRGCRNSILYHLHHRHGIRIMIRSGSHKNVEVIHGAGGRQ